MDDNKNNLHNDNNNGGGETADGGDNSRADAGYREIASNKLDARIAEFESFLETSATVDRAKTNVPDFDPDINFDFGKHILKLSDAPAKKAAGGVKSGKREHGTNAIRNIHGGHRERMRKTVRHDPTLEALSDIEVLEYILANAVPYKDTNPAAHALIDKFGSLMGVFRADEEDIRSVPNVTRNAARLLRLLPRVYESGGVREMDGSTHTDVLSFVLSMFVGDERIGTFVTYFDEKFGFAAVEKLETAGGGRDNARLRRDIVGSVCKYGAKYVLIANRGRDLFPDVKNLRGEVRAIETVLAAVDAVLSDYIVVCEFGYYTLGVTAHTDDGPEFIFVPLQTVSRAPELVTRLTDEFDE